MKILCKGRVSTEFWAFPHQEVRWNYHILRSGSFLSYKFVEVLVTPLYIEINGITFSKCIRETSWKETFDKKLFFSLWIWIGLLKLLENAQNLVDTGRKLNVHKTFRRRPGRHLNVLCTFNLRPVCTGIFHSVILQIMKFSSKGPLMAPGLKTSAKKSSIITFTVISTYSI